MRVRSDQMRTGDGCYHTVLTGLSLTDSVGTKAALLKL